MDYQVSIEAIKSLILPILEARDMELVEINFIRARPRPILKILADKLEGRISLDECAALNRVISDLLDAQDIIRSGYVLEISSPGLDRPLEAERDFLRCVNREVKFFLNEPISGKVELEGKITKVTVDAVYIDSEAKVLEIPFSKINKARQVIG